MKSALEICEENSKFEKIIELHLEFQKKIIAEKLLFGTDDGDFRKVWVDASISGNSRLLLTLFPKKVSESYFMRSLHMKDFIAFDPNGNREKEVKRIEKIADELIAQI